jgi:hypothetical protein
MGGTAHRWTGTAQPAPRWPARILDACEKNIDTRTAPFIEPLVVILLLPGIRRFGGNTDL